MIDTLVLHIHNISSYSKVYEQYYAPCEKKGTISQAYVDNVSGEILEKKFSSAYIFHDTSRVLPLMYRSSRFVASSHYNLLYRINTTKDILEFNFSIPKYLYSTNVIQFINYYDQGVHVMYLELMSFIRKFLKVNFITEPLLQDVEIHRIDFCYNQIFITPEDAFEYLDHQKDLLKKFARSSGNNFRSYDSSLMYTTRRYSFKIYHKGTEFKKNDLKALMKKNPLNLDLGYLERESEKILRYEMTFRKSMLNYLIQHYFNVSKRLVEYAVYKDHPYTKFCRSMVNDHKAYDSYTKSEKKFVLKSHFDLKCSDEVRYNAKDITFDEVVFSILYKTFRDKIVQYQLSIAPSVAGIVDRLEAYNSDCDMRNEFRRKKKVDLAVLE